MDHAEQVVAAATQSQRVLCPRCSQDRKKKNPTLSITVEAGKNLYNCWHCGWSGKTEPEPIKDYTALLPPKPIPQVIHIPTQLAQDQQQIVDFFSRRGVFITDLSALPPMMTGVKFFHGVGSVDAIGFIYGEAHQPAAIKWRAIHRKAFTQDNAASTFYGMAHLKKDDATVIIVEGEADVIALATIGIKAISCPNGAPMKVSNRRISAEEDGKFGYVWEARELLDKATKVILAVDQDEAGEALAEELARRIGREKCWQPTYPEGCKDVSDVLAAHGAESVALLINKSEAMPLAGVYGVAEYQDELHEFYKNGHGRGESTGLRAVDDLFTIKEGCMSIVTGLPSSGKSEFVDQMMVNLALSKSWKFAVASFENPPAIHIAKLAEKIVGKPFYEGAIPRMRMDELRSATDFINDHFVFLESKEGSPATIDSILDRTRQAVMRLGVRGLVIDPYNYLEQASNVEEYQSISRILTQVTTFCKAFGLHVWFVAHPAKMQMREDGTYPVPQGMHISGSAAWFAKADLGVTVHRGKQGVEIHCWKSRFKWMGQQGMTLLGYDVPTGRYFDGHREVGQVIPNKTKAAVASHWQDVDDKY